MVDCQRQATGAADGATRRPDRAAGFATRHARVKRASLQWCARTTCNCWRSCIPHEPELGQERAFVRALAALDELAPDSPDVRLLKARALFHLDRRPAALHALGTPQTSAERAMLAAINGNLPDLEREVAQIESPVHRLLAEIELADLRDHYGVLERAQFVRDVVPRIGNSPEWGLLLHRRYMEWDRWEQRIEHHAQGAARPDVPRRGVHGRLDDTRAGGPRTGRLRSWARRVVRPGALVATAGGEAGRMVLPGGTRPEAMGCAGI